MHSLFWKIFGWFWGAMALTVIAFATVVANTQPDAFITRTPRRLDAHRPNSRPDFAHPDEPHGPHPDDHGPDDGPRPDDRPFNSSEASGPMVEVQIGAELLQASGLHAADAYFKRLEAEAPARAQLFDASGAPLPRHRAEANDAFGAQRPAVEERLERLARFAAQSGQLAITKPGPVLMAAIPARAPGGTVYTLGIAWRNDGIAPRRGPGRVLDWLLFAPVQTQALRLLAALATTGLVCFLLARHLTAPLFQLRAATQQLAGGDLSARVGNLRERRDEMGALGRDFNRMAERIESLVHAQNRLIADVSHELRSPLARLGLALGLVRETAGRAAQDDLDRIEREAERLNALIGQLLTLSRLESGEQKPATARVDLSVLLAQVCADADFEAHGRGCRVQLESCDACVMTGTESLLRSALENVLRNAARYTIEGSVVEVQLKCNLGASIRVRDRGPGVPEDVLPHLFRPFYRVEDARDRQSGGAGLGLAITEQAIRLHGGTVKASNAPDGGLIVELRLPHANTA